MLNSSATSQSTVVDRTPSGGQHRGTPTGLLTFELDLYERKFLDARIDDVVLDAQVVTASARRVQRRVSQPAAQRDHHQPRRSEA
jgi:hypothetical protein